MTNQTPLILVLDDEPIILELCVEFLTTEGYKVDTAGNGKEALSLLQEKDYDVVISDMKMPSLSGAEFYKIVNERYPKVAKRIIFVTGDMLNVETKAFLENTNNPYLIKPFKLNELRNIVKEVIKGSS
ncbi:MAG: response regulator [Nitrospirota bacterium]